MERMRKLFASALGAIGTGFTNFVSGFAHQEPDCHTRSLSDSTSQKWEVVEVLVIVLLTLLVGSCLLVEYGIGAGVIMATPESQGGLDYQDGGFVSGTELYALTGDLSELAVRTGAPPSVDRRGNVLLVYDFRYGIGRATTLTAELGEAPIIMGTRSQYGGYSLRLDRLADADSWSGFVIGVPAREIGKVGVEVIFCTDSGDVNAKLYLYRYTGTKYVTGGLRWDTRDGSVYLGTDDVGYAQSETKIDTAPNLTMQHSMKLVIDESAEEYARAYVSGQAIDMPDKDVRTGATTIEPKTYLYFYNGLGPTEASEIYVDALIITCNEP